MDKILGEVFDEYVDKQIKVRQKSLGKSQKSTDDLLVFNSSTPWIRLSSSVLVDEDKAKTLATNLGINQSKIVGNNLARNLVLFAGTSDGANLSNRKGGVGYGLESSYGFLSDGEQGYKPMPGVTSITANYKNNGTLKQAQVNLTCFTRKQFEAIEAIYLRLGYTMILEWGHSTYFDNSDPPKKKNMSSLQIPNTLFTENLPNPNDEGQKAVEEALKKNPNLTNNQKDVIYYGIERKVREDNKEYPTRLRAALEQNKEKTGGNYDAMVAKVSNFSWTLNSDLSYSITLDLVSVGDIIDSLKMNFGGTQLSENIWNNINVADGVKNITAIRLSSGASAFNSFLNELVDVLLDPEVLGQLDKNVQNQLNEADVAQAQEPLIQPIKDKYLAAIEQYLKNLQPFIDARNLLKENDIFDLKTEGGFRSARSYGYETKPGVITKFNNLIKEHNSKAPSLFQINADKHLKPDRISIVSINALNLDVEDAYIDVSPFNPFDDDLFLISKIKENKTDNSILSRYVKPRQKSLEEFKAFFNDLTSTGEKSRRDLIDYLDKRKNSARDVIDLLLKDRYFDSEENFPFSEDQEN